MCTKLMIYIVYVNFPNISKYRNYEMLSPHNYV